MTDCILHARRTLACSRKFLINLIHSLVNIKCFAQIVVFSGVLRRVITLPDCDLKEKTIVRVPIEYVCFCTNITCEFLNTSIFENM